MLAETDSGATPSLMERFEDGRLTRKPKVERCRFQTDGHLHHLRQQRRRPRSKAIPPAAQRVTRQVKPSGERTQLDSVRGSERQSALRSIERCAVILGNPGSGTSSLLNKLARDTARDTKIGRYSRNGSHRWSLYFESMQ
jgi:hypothetical protein